MNETTKKIIEFYSPGGEINRLIMDKAHRAEFLVTMDYLHKLLKPGMKILDVGAGTGVYTHALASEGYEVEAIELVPKNLELLMENAPKDGKINAYEGTALDLSRYEDNTFDLVIEFGPLYHLYDMEERKLACREAIRVAKSGAPILFAFCLQDAPLIQYIFQSDNPAEFIQTIGYDEKRAIVTENTGSTIRLDTIDTIEELFNEVCRENSVTKAKLFAQDGISHIIRDAVNAMDEKSYKAYLRYLIASAEKTELIGYSNHVVQMIYKK